MRQADAGHLSTEELLRTLDGELTESQGVAADAHLAVCEECRSRAHALGVLSVRLESWVASMPVPVAGSGRAAFEQLLSAREPRRSNSGGEMTTTRAIWSGGPGLWHWTASAGVAAAVVIAAMLSPGLRSLHHTEPTEVSGSPVAAAAQVFEVAGETFVALPYSNGDLPLSSPHIVKMEVPVTSLTEAGIVFEPVSSEQSNPDRAVLADVLIGIDGEPLGVHVLVGE